MPGAPHSRNCRMTLFRGGLLPAWFRSTEMAGSSPPLNNL
jgi:hypothetical protein